MRLLRKCVNVVVIAICCGIPQLGFCSLELAVVPNALRYFEPVYRRITQLPFSTAVVYGAQVSMSGTGITVHILSFPDIAASSFDVMLGRFPAGTYTVTVERFGV